MSATTALKTTEFEEKVLKSNVPVLIDFWAEWCGPCKMMDPAIGQISAEYAGKLHVYKVNVDEEGTLAAKFQIMSIPTLLLFKGGREVDRMIGAAPKARIANFIQQHL